MLSNINRDTYKQLLIEFQPKVIETEAEYTQAHRAVLKLVLQENLTPEATEILKLIAALLKDYENKQKPVEIVTPHEVLSHLMEENNLRQVDLVGKIGSLGVVSEIVNGKRQISKSQAEVLGEMFYISPAVFI